MSRRVQITRVVEYKLHKQQSTNFKLKYWQCQIVGQTLACTSPESISSVIFNGFPSTLISFMQPTNGVQQSNPRRAGQGCPPKNNGLLVSVELTPGTPTFHTGLLTAFLKKVFLKLFQKKKLILPIPGWANILLTDSVTTFFAFTAEKTFV